MLRFFQNGARSSVCLTRKLRNKHAFCMCEINPFTPLGMRVNSSGSEGVWGDIGVSRFCTWWRYR